MNELMKFTLILNYDWLAVGGVHFLQACGYLEVTNEPEVDPSTKNKQQH